MPQYYLWTIGCQMNKAESERLGAYLEGLGYQATDRAEDADLIVLNSCVVRRSAEVKVVNKLTALKSLKRVHPDKVLAVTGCLVGSEVEPLKKSFPHVDHFFKPGELPQFVGASNSRVLPRHSAVSMFVPIIQGCNNFCSYCIVPYRRGRERSRTIAEIVSEVGELVRRGAREVTLLGQNVDSYGHDLPGSPDLADLLAELDPIDGLVRLRFLTNHPKDMSFKLIEAMARLDKVCHQLNLPVQSGSDEILRAMKRGYTAEEYRRLIAQIRNQIQGVALSTDVIVGFPSESASQFQKTVDLLSTIKFDTVHVAAYSPRPETLAARELEDNVSLQEKKERLGKVETLQEGIAAGINAGLLGQSVEVLVEGKVRGKWQGRTRSDKLVFFSDGEDCFGQLVRIKVNKTSAWSLQGKRAN